jgi:DNA-binding transcriptional regulator LsrR (DeoR family)
MARLSTADWAAARADYEVAGMSQGAIARKYGVDRRAVQKHIINQDWNLNVRATVRRETEQKVAGLVAADDPSVTAQKLEDEAGKRAEIITRHRKEWDFMRSYASAAMTYAARILDDGSLELVEGVKHEQAIQYARFAKMQSEAIKLRQDAERIAFGLDEDDSAADSLSDEHAAIRIMQILNLSVEHDG